MEEIVPRYEFRAFAQSFGPVAEKIRCLSPCENIRESAEIYVVSRGNDEINTKIRYEAIDIKRFVKQEQGLEQWTPHFKQDFPLPHPTVRQEILAAFDVSPPELERETYSQEQFVDEIIWPHPALFAAHVFKRRFSFTVNGCITEIAELLINGAAIQTVAVESEDVAAVLEAQEMLGLTGYENVNYLLALKRVMGLTPLPDAWFKA